MLDANITSLVLNIDGLPLFKSSSRGFWSILASSDSTDQVFHVGVWSGVKKPELLPFIKPLVEDLNRCDFKITFLCTLLLKLF